MSKEAKENLLTGICENLPGQSGTGQISTLTNEALRMATRGGDGHHAGLEAKLWLWRAVLYATNALDKPFDYGKNSIQKSLLDQLHARKPESEVWRQFEVAKRVRRTALRDIASRALVGRPYKEIRKQIRAGSAIKAALMAPGLPDVVESASTLHQHDSSKMNAEDPNGVSDYREFALSRLAAAFPKKMLGSEDLRTMINLALAGDRGGELITAVAAEMAKAEKNHKILGMKEAEIVMAVNWTNPDFPLWLATATALAAILRRPFGLEDLTEEGVRKTRNQKLNCESLYPILDYKVFVDGHCEFSLSPGLRVDPAPPLSVP
jgi:hypothetical protein